MRTILAQDQLFRYNGVNKSGTRISGVTNAVSLQAAREELERYYETVQVFPAGLGEKPAQMTTGMGKVNMPGEDDLDSDKARLKRLESDIEQNKDFPFGEYQQAAKLKKSIREQQGHDKDTNMSEFSQYKPDEAAKMANATGRTVLVFSNGRIAPEGSPVAKQIERSGATVTKHVEPGSKDEVSKEPSKEGQELYTKLAASSRKKEEPKPWLDRHKSGFSRSDLEGMDAGESLSQELTRRKSELKEAEKSGDRNKIETARLEIRKLRGEIDLRKERKGANDSQFILVNDEMPYEQGQIVGGNVSGYLIVEGMGLDSGAWFIRHPTITRKFETQKDAVDYAGELAMDGLNTDLEQYKKLAASSNKEDKDHAERLRKEIQERYGYKIPAQDQGGFAMDPPVSEAQRKAMGAAKSGNSTLGIPASVGKEFIDADKGGKLPNKKANDGGFIDDYRILKQSNGVQLVEGKGEDEGLWAVIEPDDHMVVESKSHAEALFRDALAARKTNKK